PRVRARLVGRRPQEPRGSLPETPLAAAPRIGTSGPVSPFCVTAYVVYDVCGDTETGSRRDLHRGEEGDGQGAEGGGGRRGEVDLQREDAGAGDASRQQHGL